MHMHMYIHALSNNMSSHPSIFIMSSTKEKREKKKKKKKKREKPRIKNT